MTNFVSVDEISKCCYFRHGKLPTLGSFDRQKSRPVGRARAAGIRNVRQLGRVVTLLIGRQFEAVKLLFVDSTMAFVSAGPMSNSPQGNA